MDVRQIILMFLLTLMGVAWVIFLAGLGRVEDQCVSHVSTFEYCNLNQGLQWFVLFLELFCILGACVSGHFAIDTLSDGVRPQWAVVGTQCSHLRTSCLPLI